jgi:sodium/hydrogen antiporter
MTFDHWFVIVGLLLVAVAVTGSILKRLPLTASMLYMGVGFLLGPVVTGAIRIDPVGRSELLERLTELAVIVSLFTAGLKLRLPLGDGRWRPPVRLAFVSMALTVALIAAAGVLLLGLSAGAAVLLGAVLAPTDPVLASDVQTEHPWDAERLRFGLTGEAGLNDGTAFPFVMLGLGLLGLHELGAYGWRWFAVDVVWAVAGGLSIGVLLGTAVGYFVLYLRRVHREAVGLDDFLALGLIALSYGVALAAHTYGFLAVFAAGVALRRVERRHTGDEPPEDLKKMVAVGEAEEIATDPEKAPAYMAQAALAFNEQLERAGELTVMVLVGAMLTPQYLAFDALWFVPVLFLVVRPASVWLGLAGSRTTALQRNLMSWFGIRGIGSIYYLTYAAGHGVERETAERLTALVLTVVAASVLLHGVTVTPLMKFYERRG